MHAEPFVIRRQILIVDDDPSIRTLLRLVAERGGFSVDVATDGAHALQHLAEVQYDLAIVDLMMPRVNGYELVAGLHALSHRPTVVIATASTDTLVAKLDAEIVHSVIRKPFDIEMVGSLMSAIVTGVGALPQKTTAVPLDNLLAFPTSEPVS